MPENHHQGLREPIDFVKLEAGDQDQSGNREKDAQMKSGTRKQDRELG